MSGCYDDYVNELYTKIEDLQAEVVRLEAELADIRCQSITAGNCDQIACPVHRSMDCGTCSTCKARAKEEK